MIEGDGDGVLLRVKVVTGASRNEIAGPVGDRLKVRVTAPPEGGKANKALCQLLAAALGVKPRHVTIERGHTSPAKTLRVSGCEAGRAKATFC
jgi:uncharacterized protein (TIGR00251 family)